MNGSKLRGGGLLAAAALAFAAGSGAVHGQVRVLQDPVFNPANGHRYVLLAPSFLSPARETAEALAGYLPTVNDADENEFLRSTFMITATPARRLWIGLTDEVDEGVFVWMNGEPVTYTNWQQVPLQPSNNTDTDAVRGEDYVEMIDSATGAWNDNVDSALIGGAGNRAFHGVVEIDPQDNPVGIGRFAPDQGVGPGQTTRLTVFVIPAQDGLATSHTVTMDGFAIDVPGTVTLLDDGNFPDDAAGDNIYSASVTPGANAPIGPQLVSYTVTDSLMRSHASGLAWIQIFQGDSCDGAVDVSLDTPITGSATGATAEGASSCQANSNRDVWFRLVAPFNGTYAFATCGSNYDTVLSVHTACPSQGGGVQVGCNDDGNGCPSFNNARITNAVLQAGSEYFVRLSAWGGVAAAADLQYTLSITGTPFTGACCVGGNCQILSEADCLSQSGDYRGDNEPCGSPSGNPVAYGPNFPGLPIGPGAAVVTEDAISVSGGASAVGAVEVGVSLTHTFVGDLTIDLISPMGTTIRLFNRLCSGGDNINATFSDAGVAVVCSGVPVVSGTVRPTNPLAGFNNQAADGLWTLRITDNAGGDGGTLSSWSLTIDAIQPIDCGGGPTPCPGNYNNDGAIDLLDLLAFNADWSANLGQNVSPGSAGDYNGNGVVDLLDLLAFNADWSANLGQPCP